jgi:hypothetical protein
MSAVLAQTTLLPSVGLSADATKLLQHLSRAGVMPAAELRQVLGKSQPTLSRALRELAGQVVPLGAARARKYALPEAILGLPARRPLTWVQDNGEHQAWGELTLLRGGQVHVAGPGIDIVSHGELPWFLAPLRIEGFIGGLLARQFAPLGLDAKPERWTLTQQLYAAAQLTDAPGALVLGELLAFTPPLLTAVLTAQPAGDDQQLTVAGDLPTDAPNPWAVNTIAGSLDFGPSTGAPSRLAGLDSTSQSTFGTEMGTGFGSALGDARPGNNQLRPIGGKALAARIAASSTPPLALRRRRADTATRCALYDHLASDVAATLPAGAFAAGSQAKFLCRITDGGAEIVKFSPPHDAPYAERWADLLQAEATALHVLAEAGLPVADTEILVSAQRCYLISQRYDRLPTTPAVGDAAARRPKAPGRRHSVPLEAVHKAFVHGPRQHWSATAQALVEQRRLSPTDAAHIRLAQAFGRLIGNTDMHFGNLALAVAPADLAKGRFTLAPIHDMLPMRYKPEVHLGEPALLPFDPDPTALASPARPWAQVYWQVMAEHGGFSRGWRMLAEAQARRTARG